MIEIQNLGFSYGRKSVLKNITMRLEGGNVYGLLGENGVGKTTLLTLLCGLKRPQEGYVTVDGRYPFERRTDLLQEQYYLPDEVAPVHARACDFAHESGRFWPNFDFDLFQRVLAEFDVDPAQRMDAMSAGQLKKTYVSFALACRTRYYYMDEPTNGMDIPSKSQFRRAITKYTGEDSTIVISTHQVRDLEDIIDPIIILDNRDVLVMASLEEIAAHLYFDYGPQIHDDALYLEQTPGGTIQVCPNTAGAESKVSLEAFFNAVYRHKDRLKSMFHSR